MSNIRKLSPKRTCKPPKEPSYGGRHEVTYVCSDKGESCASVDGLPFIGSGANQTEALESLVRAYVDVIVSRSTRIDEINGRIRRLATETGAIEEASATVTRLR